MNLPDILGIILIVALVVGAGFLLAHRKVNRPTSQQDASPLDKADKLDRR